MTRNAILDELHEARRKILADCHGDTAAYLREAQARLKASGRPIAQHEQIHRISNRHLPSFAWFKTQGGRSGLKGFFGSNASFYEEIAAYGREFWIRGQLEDVLKYAWRSTNQWDDIVGPGASALARRHILSGLPIVGTGAGAAGYSIYLIWNYHPWFNDVGGQ